MKGIGIFKGKVGSEDVAFFGCDDATLLAEIHTEAKAMVGMELHKEDPPVGTTARRVGEILVHSVDDDETYQVQSEKPETGRRPTGSPGGWAVQSLVFSKDKFTKEQAKAWIKEHKQFVDAGVDETDTSYRFRQYDPGYFGKYRTFDLADGIKAIYGQIAKEKREDADAEKDIAASIADHDAVKALNERILNKGLTLFEETIEKAEESEERYILGLVLEPNDGEEGADYKPDTQGDIYSAKAVRDSAHGFMEKYGQIDLMHSWDALSEGDVAILESYLAPVEFTIGKGKDAYKVKKGTWLMALRVKNDEIWKAIKDGKIGAFSIGGKARRTEV